MSAKAGDHGASVVWANDDDWVLACSGWEDSIKNNGRFALAA